MTARERPMARSNSQCGRWGRCERRSLPLREDVVSGDGRVRAIAMQLRGAGLSDRGWYPATVIVGVSHEGRRS